MSNGQRQSIRLPFPLKGLDENWAFNQQPEGTTSDCLNVRPYDAAEHRFRGGQRDGLAKYLTAAVNGTNTIQRIDQVTLALNPADIVVDTLLYSDDFTQANGLLSTTHWWRHEQTPSSLITAEATTVGSVVGPMVDSNILDSAAQANDYTTMGWLKDIPDPGAAYILKAQVKCGAANVIGTSTEAGFVFRGDDPSGNLVAQDYMVAGIRSVGAGATDTAFIHYGPGIVDYDVVAITIVDGTWYDLELHVNGNHILLYFDGILVLEKTSARINDHTRVGVFVGDDDVALGAQLDDFELWNGIPPTSLRETRLVAVSGGSIYTGDRSGLIAAVGGAGAVSNTRWVSSIEAFQRTYFCDGYFANYTRLIHSTRTCDDWGAAVTAHIAGTELPRGTVDNTLGCRYGALYRGRIVLWGLHEEPQNWFMSAVGNPLDWDYAPAITTATQAIAGNNCDAGELGDVIIACAPYSDDLMLMGGDHTLWIMRGDPAAGGVIDNISYQTGIASPKAFAWSPEGELYFVGANQLWRMTAGTSQPEPISQRRLDKTFREIDLGIYRIELIWDRQQQGLHIFLIPNAQPAIDDAPVHLYWDRRTDSFWKDQYPEAMGPTATHTFDADDPDDRATLFGGWDSYIRYIADGETSDDSTAIQSRVNFTPITPWGPLIEGRMTELSANLSIDSDPVYVIVSGGPDAEYVTLESPYKYARVLQPGQNPTIRQRVNGSAFMVRIYGRNEVNETWAIESLTGTFVSGGRRRKRGPI